MSPDHGESGRITRAANGFLPSLGTLGARDTDVVLAGMGLNSRRWAWPASATCRQPRARSSKEIIDLSAAA
jgi:hypothetical protein